MSNQTQSLMLSLLVGLNFLLMSVPLPGRAWKSLALAMITLPPLSRLRLKTMQPSPPRVQALCLLLCLLILPLSTSGQTPALKTTATAAPISAALPDEINKLRNEANDAVYDLDYPAARVKFEEIHQRIPDHPAGELYLATLIWIEHLNKSRRLQASLYQNESFYAGADKAKEESEGDAVDPAVDRAFRETIGRAKTKALALYNRNRKDPDALYFLGAVYGVIGGYDASVARKFLGALRNGSRGVDYHQQLIKLKPDYYDAYLSVGLYNYIVGSLPFGLKTLAAIVGTRGSKTKGTRMLEEAAAKGRYVSDDSRVMLLAIYQNEKRPEDALKILQNLSERFQHNYLFRLETATTLAQLHRSADAYRIYDELLKSDDSKKADDLVHYQYAEALAAGQEYERAAAQFLAVTKTQKAEASLSTWSLLRAGQVYDLAGKRTEALAQYKAALTRPNVYDTKEQAERGLRQPYRESGKKKFSGE